jgi:hypothetical protein
MRGSHALAADAPGLPGEVMDSCTQCFAAEEPVSRQPS